MEKTLKSAGWFAIIVSVLYIALGIVIILNPGNTLDIVSIAVGTIFLLVGIIKVLNYFIQQGKYDFYNYDLVHGLVAFAVGTIILAYTRQISTLFVVILGIWITYSGLMSLTVAMKLQATKIGSWLTVFILSLIMMVGGIVVVAYPSMAVILVGIVIIAYAIIELVQNIIFVKNIDKLNDEEKRKA